MGRRPWPPPGVRERAEDLAEVVPVGLDHPPAEAVEDAPEVIAGPRVAAVARCPAPVLEWPAVLLQPVVVHDRS